MEDVADTAGASAEMVFDMGVTVAYPFVLRAAVLLNVPKIIKSAGPGAALSAAEICSHLANPESTSSANLAKILEVLSCYGMFSRAAEGATRVIKYGLTPLSQPLADDGSPAGDWLILMTSPEIFKMWFNIHELVVMPDEAPFVRAYGKGLFQYLNEDLPEMAKFHVSVMERISQLQSRSVLEYCDEEFKSLTGTLVDVGGSEGAFGAIIASRYPNIKSVINFDLPDVIKRASPYRGVEHVAGSFLDFVPKGDMLFAKFVFLNWNDEQLVKIMTNCCNALPEKGGKMFVVDRVMPEELPVERTAARLRVVVQDLMTSIAFKGAKSRTLKEGQAAAVAGGFASYSIVKCFDSLTIFEAVKAPVVA